MMIPRRLMGDVRLALRQFPVVGIVGARQVGKTTLAKEIARSRKNAVYLDLELPSDLAKLAEPELYLRQHSRALVILDEIQRRPDLFPLLRALVDKNRRRRFLILGSATPDLTRQSSESLAGRVQYLELTPFNLAELGEDEGTIQRRWNRGGYPLSYLETDDARSMRWRHAFIQTYLERDLPNLGIRVPATMLRRFWTMLAHSHAQLWNASKIAQSLGVTPPTAQHYLDILQDTFMVRQLPPYHANVKKRLVKSRKIFLRDSGIIHALLDIPAYDALLGHPSAGASWEGFVLEQILTRVPASWQAFFYRTSAGAEIDLVLVPGGRARPLAVEIKLSLAPTPSRGFWSALEDLNPSKSHIVYPGEELYSVAKNVFVLPVSSLARLWKGR
ncbi:MAG TPA: ATP-binding protein [Vicinamibacteria bacterium]|nr:ATP-binding protein [Vicinamibacteria bacterium]